MQADLYAVGEKTRPRPPIWFLKKQFGEVNSRIEEIQCSQSPALKSQKVAAAEGPLGQEWAAKIDKVVRSIE